jgi:hypothetical protein
MAEVQAVARGLGIEIAPLEICLSPLVTDRAIKAWYRPLHE